MRISSIQHAVDLTREQWTLMRDNPTWVKTTALEVMGYDPVNLHNRCFLCAFKKQQNDTDCSTCPLVNCANTFSSYQMWVSATKAGDVASKCRYAQLILNKLDKWEKAYPEYRKRNPLTCPKRGDMFKWTTEHTICYFIFMWCGAGYALVDVHSGKTKAGVTKTAEGAFGTLKADLEYIGNAADLVFVDLNMR